MLKYSLTALTILVLSSSCGKKEEEVEVMDPLLLQGTWLSACLPSGDLYEQKSSAFKGAEVTMKTSRFADAECTEVVDFIEGVAAYSLASIDTTKSDIAPNSINYVFESITWNFTKEPSDATDYAVACASTAVRGVVDILDKTCAISDTISKAFTKDAFGLVEIRDSALLITDFDTNGATEALRPTQYPSKTGLTLQPAAAAE